MFSQKFGCTCPLPDSVTNRLLATSRWVSPTSLASVRSTSTLICG